MALGFATTLRTSRATVVRDAIDAGSGPGKIRIYNGTRPATGGTVTTLLAELTCSDPCGTVTNGVLTLSTITADSSADNSGTATWFRIVDETSMVSASDMLKLHQISAAMGEEEWAASRKFLFNAGRHVGG